MSQVKRFVTTCDCMSETAWGDYVRHSDYAALEVERDNLRTANQRLEGEVARLREVMQAAYDSDPQVPHPATAVKVSEGRKMCIYRMRKLLKAALSTANGEVTE